MGSPSRFLSGLATVSKEKPLGSYPFPDPFHSSSTADHGVASFADDFTGQVPIASYSIGGTSSTFALADGVGGFATLTPGGATTASSAYLTAAPFQFQSGNKFWFNVRLSASVVTGILFYAGMIKTGATATDSLIFRKAAAGTVLELVSVVNSTTTVLLTGLTTPAAGTQFDASYYYDGTDLLVYVSGALVGRVTAPTIGATNAFTLTNAALTPIVGLTPLASETLSVDYIMAAQELSR